MHYNSQFQVYTRDNPAVYLIGTLFRIKSIVQQRISHMVSTIPSRTRTERFSIWQPHAWESGFHNISLFRGNFKNNIFVHRFGVCVHLLSFFTYTASCNKWLKNLTYVQFQQVQTENIFFHIVIIMILLENDVNIVGA